MSMEFTRPHTPTLCTTLTHISLHSQTIPPHLNTPKCSQKESHLPLLLLLLPLVFFSLALVFCTVIVLLLYIFSQIYKHLRWFFVHLFTPPSILWMQLIAHRTGPPVAFLLNFVLVCCFCICFVNITKNANNKKIFKSFSYYHETMAIRNTQTNESENK